MDFAKMWAELQAMLLGQTVILTGLRILAIVVLGYMALKLVIRFTRKALEKHTTEHVRKLLLRGVYYAGVLFIIISVLHELNFQIGALLGAAGIFTAAIGFASQTSVSNIISGLFLLSESPFKIGDFIEVAGTSGTVYSIDLLSVKLRRSNGTFVRVPHTTIISSSVVNTSYFKERRFEFKVLISHKENVNRVIELVRLVIQDNQYAFQEKAPLIVCEEFNDSTVSIKVGVWASQKNWLQLKATIIPDVQERFTKEQILMPTPMIVNLTKTELF